LIVRRSDIWGFAYFGARAGGGEMVGFLDSALVQVALVIVGIFVFFKFCSFAKKFTLPGKVKLVAYIITGLGVVALNYFFSSAKKGLGAEVILTDPTVMGLTLLGSFIVVFIFAFALMAETKS
jgi:hypothetical protein